MPKSYVAIVTETIVRHVQIPAARSSSDAAGQAGVWCADHLAQPDPEGENDRVVAYSFTVNKVGQVDADG